MQKQREAKAKAENENKRKQQSRRAAERNRDDRVNGSGRAAGFSEFENEFEIAIDTHKNDPE